DVALGSLSQNNIKKASSTTNIVDDLNSILGVKKIYIKDKSAECLADNLQNEAIKEENTPAEMMRGLDQQMKKEDKGLYFMDRIWVPLIGDLRTMIMGEEHTTRSSIHPGADKMYYDLRDMYWWPVLADVAEGIGNTTKHEYDLSSSNRWTNYHSSIQCAPFKALYGRKCRPHVLWAKVGENRLIGPEMVQETIDKVVLIKVRLKAARDHQKIYADNMREPIEFEVDNKCYLKCRRGTL
ncbi:putative reverse transcriptase domain-containing protein, partial [Tanacetum coccineum]